MPSRLSDTHPDVDKIQLELLRNMPASRKFQLVNDLIMAGRMLSMSGLRARFPGATPVELRRRLSTLVLGSNLATRVYGPEPLPHTLR